MLLLSFFDDCVLLKNVHVYISNVWFICWNIHNRSIHFFWLTWKCLVFGVYDIHTEYLRMKEWCCLLVLDINSVFWYWRDDIWAYMWNEMRRKWIGNYLLYDQESSTTICENNISVYHVWQCESEMCIRVRVSEVITLRFSWWLELITPSAWEIYYAFLCEAGSMHDAHISSLGGVWEGMAHEC